MTDAERIAELEAKLAEAERERDRLRVYEPRLMSATADGAEVRITARAPIAADLALSLAEVLARENAPNYAEVKVTHPERGVFAVTVQRCEGSTPAELRRKAEERALELEAEVEAAESREKALREALGFNPTTLPRGCGQLGPRGLACDAHGEEQHLSLTIHCVRGDEVQDRWPRAALAAGEETKPR